MKTRILAIAVTAISLGFSVAPAQAKGCLKGAAVGGVAGHVAGHHGLAGAGIGCLVGKHRAKKAERAEQEQAARQDTTQTQPVPQQRTTTANHS